MSYVYRIRQVLTTTLSKIEAEGWLGQAIENKEIFLQPPKNEARGDLTTNAAMVIAAKSGREVAQVAQIFLDAFHGTDAVFSAELIGQGYINIIVSPDYLATELARVLLHYDRLTPSKAAQQSDCILPYPSDISDLISARVKLNSECVKRIADQYGLPTRTEPWTINTEAGFSYEAAVAKCSESMTQLYLLAYPRALSREFSPHEVIDRSYDNPGFAIPYAYAHASRSIAHSFENGDPVPLEKLSTAARQSLFTDIAEKRLIKQISQWHSVVERVYGARDVEGLIAYLRRLSQLFFELSDRHRLISGNYLKSSDDKLARLGLIMGTGLVLAKGMEFLGFEAEAEVR